MATYGLNPNGLLDTGEELRGITHSIQNSIDELNSDVGVFISSNTGDAADAFTHAQADWQAGIAQMQAALAVGIQRINEIHDTYKLGDARGAALFQGHV
jgi:WXG100 family type VII secretion target